VKYTDSFNSRHHILFIHS